MGYDEFALRVVGAKVDVVVWRGGKLVENLREREHGQVIDNEAVAFLFLELVVVNLFYQIVGMFGRECYELCIKGVVAGNGAAGFKVVLGNDKDVVEIVILMTTAESEHLLYLM